MKKTVLLIILAICVFITGCGGKKTSDASTSVPVPLPTVESGTEAATSPQTDSSVSSSVPESESATDAPKATSAPDSSSAVETPTQKATEAPTQAPATTPANQSSVPAGEFCAEDMIFSFNGGSGKPGGDASALIAALGAPKDIMQGQMCLYDENDKVYIYDSLSIYVYTINGKEIIYEITFLNNTVSTARGLKIGMTPEKAELLYGKPEDFRGMYRYNLDAKTYLYYTLSGGIIDSIVYISEL